jgi:hypothetical protein
MGFWQGINRGFAAVQEEKIRKRERQEELDLRKAERAEDRAFRREDQQDALKTNILGGLYQTIIERGDLTKQASDVTHELSVLKSYGASDEALAEAAVLGPEALQQAVSYVEEQTKKFEGSPITVGPAQIDSILNAAVSTVYEGGTADMEKAIRVLGLTPEELDQPFIGGMTAREVVEQGLKKPSQRKTTFVYNPQGKPLDEADVATIQTSANKNLRDSLNSQQVFLSNQSKAFSEKAMTVGLTEEEIGLQEKVNGELRQIGLAKEALDLDAPAAAIQVAGGQAIMPYIMNNPTALAYNFGPGWSQAIQKYTFSSEEEAKAAYKNGVLKKGDIVNVNGVMGTVK